MALTVLYNGVNYTDIISVTVSASIGTFAGQFSVTASADQNQSLPVKKGGTVKILADGQPILTGFIETIDGSYSASSHSITFSGRSKTADLIDSTVKGAKQFNAGIGFVSIIESVLKGQGITDIKVKNLAGSIASFTDASSAEIGETAFEFLERLSRKVQVVLTCDGNGDIVLTRSGTASSNLVILNKLNDPQNLNNVKESSFYTSDAQRFNSYKVLAQENPLNSLDSLPNALTGVLGSATDKEIRNTRHLEFYGEESMTPAQSKNRASWEANVRRARSFEYRVIVQGHSINGTLWDFNRVVSVQDDFWGISAGLLIADLKYDFSIGSGSTTEIVMTYPDAFSLEANLSAIKDATQKTDQRWNI